MINPKLQYISNILKIFFKGSDLAMLDSPDKLLTGALVDLSGGRSNLCEKSTGIN